MRRGLWCAGPPEGRFNAAYATPKVLLEPGGVHRWRNLHHLTGLHVVDWWRRQVWLKGNHTIICHVEAITLSAERQAINSEDVFRRRGDTPP